MHGLGWGVVLLYAGAVFLIGWLTSRKQSGTDEFFRGGRRLPWWALGISIIATAFSAASLLGGPGEGYGHGFLWLQLQLGDLIGYLLVCIFFLPLFARLDLTTAYEWLEMRFDAKTRSLASIYFILFVVVRLGALLYGAALVVAEVSDLSLPVSICIVGVVAVIYTVAGGLAAVVWTDVLQWGVVMLGIGACLFVVQSEVDGGMSQIIATARAGGRWTLLDLSWNPQSIRALPTAILAYGMLAFAVAGTNQQSVQRYLACADVRASRRAAMLAWGAGFIGVGGTLLLGVFLYAFYQATPGHLAADVQPDRILPIFIANELPAALAGLLAAAIFAAAMSSCDSAMHSFSTCLVVDFYRRYFKRHADERHYLRVARLLVLLSGAIGIISAFYVAGKGQSLLSFLATYTSYFVGPVLGLFLLGMWSPRANGHGAFWGACVAAGGLLLFNQLGPWKIPGVWFSAVSAPLTYIFGTLISLVVKRTPIPARPGLSASAAAARIL